MSTKLISKNIDASRLTINHTKKLKFEQFFTSSKLSNFMSSMMNFNQKEIHILDPGAGMGALSIACFEKILRQNKKPEKITITAYEIDSKLIPHLNKLFNKIRRISKENNIKFSSRLIHKNFIFDSVNKIQKNNFQKYTHVIINPPYKKIKVDSSVNKNLKKINLQLPNTYAAFVLISQDLLKNNGEMVYITPRSFCNGPYFQSFREKLLKEMSLRKIHSFTSRNTLFGGDVLQETIIVHAVKKPNSRKRIKISSNSEPSDKKISAKLINLNSVIFPKDSQKFIHIITDSKNESISKKIQKLTTTLSELNLEVSTGKVVDFRADEYVRSHNSNKTVPLIHPFNLSNKIIKFPINYKKPNFIQFNKKTKSILIQNGNYVLVKRFTTREENKRIVASVFYKNKFNFKTIGFENRLNFFHHNRKGMNLNLAKGLTVFLSSTIVDSYFRQFNGHTQVNATDLRYLGYPTLKQLKKLGSIFNADMSQEEIDRIMSKIVFSK